MARPVDAPASGAGFHDAPHARERLAWRELLRPALRAAPVLPATLMVISEIAAQATFKPGVLSSTWTPVRGVAALIFGIGSYGGDFAPLPILAGLAILLAYAVGAGALGAAALVVTLGPRPHAGLAALLGLAYGVLAQALTINVCVNVVQAEPTVYRALPTWGWWVAHAVFGAVLGLAVARRP